MRASERETIDLAKRQIADRVNQLVADGLFAPATVRASVHHLLGVMKAQGLLQAFQVSAELSTAGRGGSLQEVKGLGPLAAPGDPYLSSQGRYRGIVISAEGNGRGVVLARDPDDSLSDELRLHVDVQPSQALSYVRLEVTVTP